jgi:hypothetical protein
MASTNADLKAFWSSPFFFGSRLEESIAKWWYGILLLNGLLFIVWAHFLLRNIDFGDNEIWIISVIHDPYVASLCVTLILSTIAFKSWQQQFRNTFQNAVDLGIVGSGEDQISEFLFASHDLKRRTHSPLRFLFSVTAMCVTLIANRDVIAYTLAPLYGPVRYFFLTAVLSMLFYSYAVGAVAWCLTSTSLWIAAISTRILRIQPGHSDGCCGLEEVGNCCLQSALPLLIGMLLCLVWANSRRIVGFKTFSEGWLSIIIPVAYVLMILFLALACALVFLPVRGLHRRLESYKTDRERDYTSALEKELSKIQEALAKNDEALAKNSTDRIKLIQTLDPTALKLSTWPFDKASLVKYGVTPLVSLLGTFGKDLFKLIGGS